MVVKRFSGAGGFGSNREPHSYRNRSSVAQNTSFDPAATFVATSFMMWSRGREWRRRFVGEQNWHPRPHPRVISTTPYEAAFRIAGVKSIGAFEPWASFSP